MDDMCDLCNKNEVFWYVGAPKIMMCKMCRRKKKSRAVQALMRRARKNFDSYNEDVDEGFRIGVLTALGIVLKCENKEEL